MPVFGLTQVWQYVLRPVRNAAVFDCDIIRLEFDDEVGALAWVDFDPNGFFVLHIFAVVFQWNAVVVEFDSFDVCEAKLFDDIVQAGMIDVLFGRNLNRVVFAVVAQHAGSDGSLRDVHHILARLFREIVEMRFLDIRQAGEYLSGVQSD